MTTSLFIVTFKKDFPYLVYCLRSIEKFATGFHEINILVPAEDYDALAEIIVANCTHPKVVISTGDEWPDKGFLWHECQICRADEWNPHADFIVHFDADCVFTAPVTPETFMRDGKPLLRYEPFESIGKRHPAMLRWKEATEKCLPFTVPNEHMRGHPQCYLRDTYKLTREQVEKKTGMKFDDYVISCENTFPQGFTEHPTLGAVAFHSEREKYFPFDCATQENPDYSEYPVFQSWSHKPPNEPTDVWYQGKQVRIVPLDIYKEIGIA